MEDQAPPFDLPPNQNPISDRKDLFHYKKQKQGEGGNEREKKSIMAYKNKKDYHHWTTVFVP